MQEKKVTVVIPNYNGIKYIKPCMDALRAQREEGQSFDILVVDNGSEDGSLEVLQQYSEAKVLSLPENTGFCHAVNLGICESKTPYVILLNNDTVVKSGFVRYLLDAIEQSDRIFSVSAQMLSMQDEQLIDDAGDRYCVLGWAYARGKGKRASGYEKPVRIFAACGGASIYRRDLILGELGGFDENHFAYMEDVDIGYRANIYGYQNLYEPRAKVIHAGSAASGSRYNEFKTRLASANNAYLIGKNMPLLQIVLNLPFLLLGFLIKALFFARKRMGHLYISGYCQGIAKCFSPDGRRHKVKFRWHHLGNYLQIQLFLYIDTVRYIFKR